MIRRKGFLICMLLCASTLVRAADDYQEVSYEDLVNQINQKKTKVIRSANDPFDMIKLHAGLGLITSANTITMGDGTDALKYQNGFQLSLGIDLFSPNWVAETALRNFGTAQSGTERRSLREFDLKLMHRDLVSEKAGYRLGAGIGNRYLKVDDGANRISIDDDTPTAVFFGGIDMLMNRNFSFGIETGLRTSMVNRTSDRSSLDLTFRMDTYF